MPRTNYTAPVVVSDIYVFFSRPPGSVVVERTYGRLAARRAHTLQAQVPRVLCTEPSSQLHALVDSPPERPQDKDQTTILAHPGRAYLIDGTVRMYRHLLRTVAPAPVHGPSCSQKFQCRRASGCNGQKLRCTSGRPARLRHEMDGRMGWDGIGGGSRSGSRGLFDPSTSPAYPLHACARSNPSQLPPLSSP